MMLFPWDSEQVHHEGVIREIMQSTAVPDFKGVQFVGTWVYVEQEVIIL